MNFIVPSLKCFKQITVMLLAGLIAACQNQTQNLRVAVSPWLGFEPIFLAKQLAYEGSASYKVSELTTPSHVMHAIKSNQVDAAFLSLTEVITLLSERVELTVVAVIDRSVGGDALVSQQAIGDISSLKGKRIGYESLSVASLVIDDWLQDSELQADDFVLVEAKLDEQLGLFRKGDISAVLTSGPIQSRLVDNLSGNVLYQSAVQSEPYYRVLVVRTKALHDQKQNVLKLLNNFYSASSWLEEHSREGFKLIAKRTQLYSKEVKQAYTKIQVLNAQQSISLFSSNFISGHAQQKAQRMADLELIRRAPDLSRNFSSEWLMELTGV
ncbi:ABC transporter substrate-binding protein [Agarivorans sp. MS3-6]|uniref:ABC transporter substrate-binding protein n=1 Tax=Agarivorans sp. TSD2052 TaxID=2937286 RepID=UPI00200D920B|nr:ABC transporter substrate-binding protein [Agarivorans sp. TSD2052]UPW20447.1 ABC transporter substrate-binding protein [Agarivorans sp. TSD2052]